MGGWVRAQALGRRWPDGIIATAPAAEPYMLYQIAALLLHVAAGLVAGMCLLRLYLQSQSISMAARAGNPLGPFIFACTNWLVLPLRRVLRPIGRWDIASLAAALLVELALYSVLWLLQGAQGGGLQVLWQAVFGLVRLVLSGATGLLIVYVLLSWVQSNSPLVALIDRVVSPWLRPIRRVVPLLGGVDLSPLVLLILLQIAGIVLDSVAGAGPR